MPYPSTPPTVEPGTLEASSTDLKAPDPKATVEEVDSFVVAGNKATDGLEDSGNRSPASVRKVDYQDGVAPETLNDAVETLELKNTKWWAYFQTKDFWIVLVLGYVLHDVEERGGRVGSHCNPDRFWLSVSRQPILSQPCWSIRGPPSRPSRRCSIMSSWR